MTEKGVICLSEDIPKTIKEAGVHEQAFLEKLDELAEHAFDDQCTGTNPRYPLISEIKELFKAAYYGREVYEKMDSPLKLVEAKPAKAKKTRAKKAS